MTDRICNRPDLGALISRIGVSLPQSTEALDRRDSDTTQSRQCVLVYIRVEDRSQHLERKDDG